MAPRVQTVTGVQAPDTLGATLMHEHLLCDVTPPAMRGTHATEVEIRLDNVWSIRQHWCDHLGNNRLSDPQLLVAELRDFAEAGGGAVVELTTSGIGPDRRGLAQLARESGVAVIAGCGYYTEPFLDREQCSLSVEGYAGAMLAALDPRQEAPAGIIGEIGCSDVLTDTEKRILRGAAQAQQDSGAAINVHPSRRVEGLFEAITILKDAGAELSRVVMSHIDRTLFNTDDLFRLADAGVVIEYDFFGIESSYYPFDETVDLPNDAQRVAWIRKLVDRGHLIQIALSQDICTRTRLRRLGGHGYAHLLVNVVPLLSRRGFSEQEIDTLLVETPRRLLALQ